jgi:RNA polymerase sigma factor (sigma-70 family)
MSRFDPRNPAKRGEAAASASPMIVTRTGVRVFVQDRLYRMPEPDEPERRPRMPRAIIVPANQPSEDRNAFIAWLEKQWGPFIQSQLLRAGGIPPESAKDLHQQVLLVLSDFYETNHDRGPDDVPAYLERVVDNAVCNYRRLRRLAVQLGAELDEEIASTPDPERAAMLSELWKKLEGYVRKLTPEEAEVFEAREIHEQSFDAIAAALGRPRTTVINQHARAMEKLGELARASERATALGARRRRAGGGQGR